MLLSQSTAKALFDDADPINKTIRIDNQFDLTVGGVYEDLPLNTTFANAKFLMPWDNRINGLNTITDWDNHSCELFVQLSEEADLDQISDKIKSIPTLHIIQSTNEQIMLHPMDKIHLYGEFQNGKMAGGRIQFVWLIGIIGGFVLLLACINFMNLSTARSEKRSKEVGIRKTIGSHRNQLMEQFLVESIVVALIALVLSIIFAQLSLPFFNSLANKQMYIHWGSPIFWLSIVGFALFSGIISGSYPAFYLSSFNPVKVLKGTFKAGRFSSLPRKVLVVIQFTVSITLIIGTVIVFKQIEFAKDRPVGYSRNGLISIPIKTPDLQGHYDAVRNDLLQTGAVENMAESSHQITEFDNNNAVEWQGKDPAIEIDFRDANVTPDFGKTIGWTIKEGRDFSRDIASDSSAVLLNETGARITKLKNPLGEMMKYSGKEYKIIGIVSDMVTRSPYKRTEPAIFIMGKWLSVITIRIKPRASMKESLTKIELIFKKHNPNAPFEFKFVDEEYGRKFSQEEQIGNLARVFAVLAIAISCLGLFGLASFVAEQRTKEVGIRKIMGASVVNLWRMLSTDFVVLVLFSCLIAVPISYYFLSDWLQGYQYRTEISWWIFVATGMGALVVTLATVSFQAVKAALMNPVNSLKSE
jgi:putative ABC transport system permease protein